MELEDGIQRVYPVPIPRLDDLLQGTPFKIFFLQKIDKGGHEKAVLGGGELLSQTMVLLTETHSEAKREAKRDEQLTLIGPNWQSVHGKTTTVFACRSQMKSKQ